jgi:hypothetical protein
MMTRLVNDPMNSLFWGHRRMETNKIISISLPVPCVNQIMGFIRQGQLQIMDRTEKVRHLRGWYLMALHE